MATRLWYNFFNNCFIASWGFIMFNKQKEKLKSQLAAKSYEMKQAAKERITDSLPDPVKKVADFKEQRDLDKATKYIKIDVAGCFAHQVELESLGTLNPKFDTDAPGTQYKYKFPPDLTVDLEFEPTNEHDPHAIMVKLNGVFIGYVPRAENIEIGKFIRAGKAKAITAKVRGGDCSYHMNGNKYVEPNDIECFVYIYHK